jgi:hypothetical protein
MFDSGELAGAEIFVFTTISTQVLGHTWDFFPTDKVYRACAKCKNEDYCILGCGLM